MNRRSFFLTLASGLATAQTDEIPKRVKVPGVLTLRARERAGRLTERTLRWPVSETAIIICDMWDTHTCSLAAQRVSVMAPRMNQVVSAARALGVTIIHAPSDTMKFYEGTPARRRLQSAPKAGGAIPIASCPREPAEAREFPIDDSAGGCDDPVVKKWTGPYPWTRQHPAIDILGFDGVSDNGQEVYNYFRQEGITNVALMGVHTNMCILNRSFAIRQMKRLGMNIVLVRDLTDAMYDPRARPFVSHTRGTELVIEHIEAKWCPSILSEDLTRAST
jgi:nicotinamidase-related amidase